MAKVRGSKQHKLVVRSYRPWRRFTFFLVLLLIGAALGSGGFVAGLFYQNQLQTVAPGDRTRLRQMKQQITTLTRDRLVDKVAVENSRKAIKEMEDQLRQLGKEVAFYKSVMNPEADVKGLHVQGLAVARGAAENEFTVNWVMTQVGKNDEPLTGAAELRLTGSEDGIPGVLEMGQLAAAQDEVKFKFRYFQNMSLGIQVPPDFVVEKVEIVAQSDGEKPQSITRQFDWVIQEALVNVRQ